MKLLTLFSDNDLLELEVNRIKYWREHSIYEAYSCILSLGGVK